MSKKPPIWSFKKSENFIDAVRELKEKNRPLALKLGQEMNKLAYSEYPNRLGEKKLTKYRGSICYGYRKVRRFKIVISA